MPVLNSPGELKKIGDKFRLARDRVLNPREKSYKGEAASFGDRAGLTGQIDNSLGCR